MELGAAVELMAQLLDVALLTSTRSQVFPRFYADAIALADNIFPKAQPDFEFTSAPLLGLDPIHLSDLPAHPHPGSKERFLPRSEAPPLRPTFGRVLHGVLAADAQKLGRSLRLLTILQDPADNKAVLLVINNAVGNRTTPQQIQDLFPLGARVAIKEPVLVHESNADLILLDNPANLVILSYLAQPQVEQLSALPPAMIRARGNELFRSGSFSSAAEVYRLSSEHAHQLELPVEELLALSNRAKCLLSLGRYEECVDVTGVALALDPAHPKSIYSRALALIKLHLYDWACELLRSSTVMNSALNDLLYDAQKLAEQSHSGSGAQAEVTRFVEAITAAPTTAPVVFPKLGDYTALVEVKMCPDQRFNRGRGLFATRAIRKGEVVLVNNNNMLRLGTENRKQDEVVLLLELVMKSDRSYRQVYSLTNREEVPEMNVFSPNWITAEEWGNYRQSIGRELLEGINVKKLYELHRLRDDDDDGDGDVDRSRLVRGAIGCATAFLSCLLNHSCTPNVSRTSLGTAMYLIATRDIPPGEEIVLSYFPTVSHPDRLNELSKRRGFICDCLKCELERRLEPELVELRRFLPKVSGTGASRNVEFNLGVWALVEKLERVLNSRLETEDERQCVRASIYWVGYLMYYHSVKQGRVEPVPGIPPAEVIMQAAQKFGPGKNYHVFTVLETFATDGAAAEKVIREEWECLFGRMSDRVYELARRNALLKELWNRSA